MDDPKWWNIAVAAVTVALSVMLLVDQSIPPATMVSAQAVLAAFALTWFTLGRMSWRSRGVAVTFIILMIVLTGIGTALYPSLASLQAAAYPLMWVISHDTRRALIANVVLAATVAFAFMARFGFTPDSILHAAFIAVFSLGFSIALGLWITHISNLGVERLRLIEGLREAEGKLAALHWEAGIVSERERISRELHDTLAQGLTGLVMLTQGARRDLQASDWKKAKEALAVIEENARDALVETRSLVASGAAVEVPGGIIPALHRLGERFERETGVAISATARSLPLLDRGTEVVLLRCAQEALANIRKHASATTATVTARGIDGEVELCVSDNGVGFAADAETSGFGLAGMRDRVALVNGMLTVESTETGTTLTVRVPVALPA